MGRALRPLGEGMTYHVMSRGNNRQSIFADDLDRRSMLGLIDDARRHMSWHVHAWCLMTNHIHLLVTTDLPNLSAGLHGVIGRYARRYNRFHERTGHVFSGRFRSVVVVSEEQFLTTFRYINRNPVTAGLVATPDDYPWSGYATRSLPRPPIALDESPVLRLLHPLHAMAERQMHHLVHADTHPARAGAAVPTIGTILQVLGEDAGARAARALGHTQRDIAGALRISESTLSRRMRRSLLRAS